MIVEYSARSHVGRVRENNEDNLFINGITLSPEMRERPFAIDGSTQFPAIFAVCDGMGGEDSGEVASITAVQTLQQFSTQMKSSPSKTLNEIVGLYVEKTSQAILSQKEDVCSRTGTTLALIVAKKNGLYCFNLGDSRIYSLQKSHCRQVTNDHTAMAEQVRANTSTGVNTGAGLSASTSTTQPAINARSGHKLTCCIGIGSILPAQDYPPITGKCRILICSDGLTDMVKKAEIEHLLNIADTTENAATSLLNAALKNGGKDNITVIVLEVKPAKRSFWSRLAKR